MLDFIASSELKFTIDGTPPKARLTGTPRKPDGIGAQTSDAPAFSVKHGVAFANA